jgi:hypothetical protein
MDFEWHQNDAEKHLWHQFNATLRKTKIAEAITFSNRAAASLAAGLSAQESLGRAPCGFDTKCQNYLGVTSGRSNKT